MTGGIATYLKGLAGRTAIASSGTVAHLRLAFLVPLAGASALLLGIWATMIYLHERDVVESEVARTQMTVKKMYHDDIEHNMRMLNAVMTVIFRDAAMHAARARRDRPELLRLSAPLSTELRRQFGVSHLYFTGPDRVNLLRAHQPERHGDVIMRFTTLEAERSGSTAYGVEFGPLGTFALRLVTPWYADDARRSLIGYVEFGMEIDHVLKTVQTFADALMFVLDSKKYLQREDWERGMAMLGRTPEWNRYSELALVSNTADATPAILVDRLIAAMPEGAPVKVSAAQADFRVASLPLIDAAGRDVGRMAIPIDMTPHLASSHRTILIVIAGGVLVIGMLIGIFYVLTGPFNRRMFHALLAQEFAHARRFNRPVSLLMLDIDHFKHVNDTHGHPAGDAILKGLAELLNREARAMDHVCCYGGEELTVILPETDLHAATHVAERIRAIVEAQTFDIGDGPPLHITASFGVASWPAQADTAEALIANADAAMYTAKQRRRNQVCRYQPGDTQSVVATTSAVTATEKEA